MEDLREKVYECTLAVEAHMICDLLARAGISARVDGEFLAGVAGELPLGSTIKVRVDPSRAAEARAIIDEWEREQPPAEAKPDAVPVRSPLRSPLWFVAGVLVGTGLLYLASRSPVTSQSADFNGDGIEDEIYYYEGVTPTRVDLDRDSDGKVDARWINDFRGVAKRYEGDDNFDGRFEWTSELEQGQIVTSTLDSTGDGNPDSVMRFRHGVLGTIEVYDEAGQRIVARQHFIDGAWNDSTEFDADGDGVFERRVEFDRYGEPRTR
jgi:hypothetical protein